MDRHYYLKTSDALTDEDKAYFAKMLTGTDENIEDSIRKLSQLLYKHHGKKVVIIIDEYDVPLDKAYQNGYYREMVSLIRGLFARFSPAHRFSSPKAETYVPGAGNPPVLHPLPHSAWQSWNARQRKCLWLFPHNPRKP